MRFVDFRQDDEMACLEKSADISRALKDTSAETTSLLHLGYVSRHTGKNCTELEQGMAVCCCLYSPTAAKNT